MNEENPYAPPAADFLISDERRRKSRLADRGHRLAASIVDSIVASVFAFPMMYFLGIWNYVNRMEEVPFTRLVAASVLGLLWFLIVHGYWLMTNGQTVGKKLVGIRISDLEGNVPDFAKVLFLRYLPLSVVSLVPVVGPYLSLIDVLFIFRDDRRCIHDLIAGTKVVTVN